VTLTFVTIQGFGPDDYVIREDGQNIGRIYRNEAQSREPWLWFVNKLAIRGRPPTGRATTIEEAKKQFTAAWVRCDKRD
jgi:hypothetical protein